MTAPKRSLSRVLVTGGAGFIGSNLIRWLLAQPEFEGMVINLDALTYAGNLQNLADVADDSRYTFCQADIRDPDALATVFAEYHVDTVIHLAAESHVDRSIAEPDSFVTTNMLGTFRLLEAARAHWGTREDVLFHHVSTDEVFGSLGPTGKFTEATPYDPRSPYSASKAGSDHLVRAYGHTYGLPATVSNCSNNYGPYQFPEKLIPLMILRLLAKEELPVYGDGGNVRDWLHVQDHARAIWQIVCKAEAGSTWMVGGDNEWTNLELVHLLCEGVAEQLDESPATLKALIRHVPDRPGHDRRYAVDGSRLRRVLGWNAVVDFRRGVADTVAWYVRNAEWVASVKSGAYRLWLAQNYGSRG